MDGMINTIINVFFFSLYPNLDTLNNSTVQLQCYCSSIYTFDQAYSACSYDNSSSIHAEITKELHRPWKPVEAYFSFHTENWSGTVQEIDKVSDWYVESIF